MHKQKLRSSRETGDTFSSGTGKEDYEGGNLEISKTAQIRSISGVEGPQEKTKQRQSASEW